MENSFETPKKKLNTKLPHDLAIKALGIYPKELKIGIQTSIRR